MASLHFRSLRVQVLLWTIVPLIIVLLIVSLTGIGSHQFSVRQLVAEENINLVDVATKAVQARINLYHTLLDTQAAQEVNVRAGAAPSLRPGDHSLPPLEIWHTRNNASSDGNGADPAPAWATRAAAAAAEGNIGDTWFGFDAAAHRIVWAAAAADASGWIVGSIDAAGLGLVDLFTDTSTVVVDRSLPTIAIVDGAKQLVDTNQPLVDAAVMTGPEADQALAGERGVHVASDPSQQAVVAFAPIDGTPWAMVIQRPITDLVAPFFRLEQILPLMLLAAAVISVLTLYFGLSLVVRPVHALVDYAERIGQGDFRAASERVGGVHEIEDLRLALDHMAQQLQTEQAALQAYLRALTSAQEEERARLARELHDETVQTLIALDHKAQTVQRGLDKHPERTRDQVAELRKITAAATQEVRRLSSGLRPLGLEEIGLDSALERLAQDAHADYRCLGTACRLTSEKELAFYRIAQESLSNARRHANASCIRMMLVFGAAHVTLGVGDDGQGFHMPAKLSELTQNGHFGLMGITERTELIGGRLYCESLPGRGTVIIVQATYDAGPLNVDGEATAMVHNWLASS
ncbi:MAG: sensor histidine kinase [Caldilineaceae bacterium]